jgi:hypothetical protein
MDKYYFYKRFKDGNVSIVWDLSKAAAAKRYQRYSKDPDVGVEAWGWHPQNGSITQKLLEKAERSI